MSDEPPINIKTEIPSEEAGKALNAVTDVLRFFSEPMGLVADHVRVHREDVLLKIARKTRERLIIDGVTPNPVPNKFMVPFLEKASCEDIESELLDLWAALLANASKAYVPSSVAFVQMLAELGTAEISFLNNIVSNIESIDFGDDPDLWRLMGLEETIELNQNLIPLGPINPNEKTKEFWANWENYQTKIGPRVILKIEVPAFFGYEKKDGPTIGSIGQRTKIAMDNSLSIDLLERQCLISRHTKQFPLNTSSKLSVDIEFVSITALGLEFAKRCSLKKEENVQKNSDSQQG